MGATTQARPMAAGTFSKTPFAHILVYISRGNLGGTLEVKNAAHEVAVYFRKGMPAKARSTVPERNLGIVLQQLKLVDPNQIRVCEQEVAKNGGSLEQLLLDMNYLDVNQLVTALKEQLSRKLTDLFAMHDASYAFYKDVNMLVGYGADELFPLDPYALLMNGLRRHPNDPFIGSVLGGLKGKWISATDPETLRRFLLTDPEKRLLDQLLERPCRVDSLAAAGGHDPRVVAYVVYALTITKLAAVHNVTPEAPQAEPGEDRPSQLESRGPAPVGAYDLPTEAKRKQLLEKAAEMPAQSYYQMLGVEKEASIGEVRKAFFRLSKEYHPDKIPKALHPELKETIQYVFSNLAEAHTTLLNPDARAAYDDAVKKGRHLSSAPRIPDEEVVVHNALGAETLYQKALILMNKQQLDEAYELATEAKESAPDQAEYVILWAHLESRRRSSKAPVDDLIEQLSDAVTASPMSERGHLYLAQLYKRRGEADKAQDHFAEVLEINRHNLEAARELRLVGKTKPPKSPSSGFLGKFMKPSKAPPSKPSKKPPLS